MKSQLFKILGLTVGLSFFCQMSTAAMIKDTTLKPYEKSLSAQKALDQQKRNLTSLPKTSDELKMLNTIRVAPTQTFFASQHQRFSRFLQGLFQPYNS